MSHAVLFPGQGSQSVGMLSGHADHKSVRERIRQANEILGYDLTALMFDGPADKLTQTRYTQPAIYLHSVALYETLELSPAMAAGHSLGEFSALTVSGALSFEDGLRLVSVRGTLMQEAGESSPGSMAAIIGMDDEIVELICREASEETFKPVVAANYNSPGQVVISGHEKAVDLAIERAQGRGCRLAKKLAVSGAFHSPLMDSAYQGLKKELESVRFQVPEFPVCSNYSAEPATDPEMLKNNALEQLVNPVRWSETLTRMYEEGADRFTEVGPGKVLQGLVKRTLKGVQTEGFE